MQPLIKPHSRHYVFLTIHTALSTLRRRLARVGIFGKQWLEFHSDYETEILMGVRGVGVYWRGYGSRNRNGKGMGMVVGMGVGVDICKGVGTDTDVGMSVSM